MCATVSGAHTSLLCILFLFLKYECDTRASHLQAVKRILRYLCGTLNFSIWLSASSYISLRCFSDADFRGCRINRKSTSGSCHFLENSLITWSSRKQSSVAQSTAASEYVAAACCCSQILWIVATLKDYGINLNKVPLFCDNTSARCIAKNPVQHSRTKHIVIRFHFLWDHVEKGTVELHRIDTEHQFADIFTKPLDSSRFAFLRGELGVLHPSRLFWGRVYILVHSQFCILYIVLFFFFVVSKNLFWTS